MFEKVLLTKNLKRRGKNKTNEIRLDFQSEEAVLPENIIEKQLSLFELYKRERDNCSKYRLIIDLKPVCTNVLFNKKSEIVKNSKDNINVVTLLDDKTDLNPPQGSVNRSKLNHIQAIRDTEYSNSEIGYEYNPGLDIFNNHILRKKQFLPVNKYNFNSKADSENVYNTIEDYRRNENGDIAIRDVGLDCDTREEKKLHLYQYDTIYSFDESVTNNLKEVNGWYGFVNNSVIETKQNCDFIDMYPDRSLFSFTPKYNTLKNREERNWEYIITYPAFSDKDKFNEINGNVCNGIRCFFKKGKDSNGHDVLKCCSLFKHNLVRNDLVRLYYTDKNGKTNRFPQSVRVSKTGNEDGHMSDWIFNIEFELVYPFFSQFENGELFFRKEIKSVECEYYIHKLMPLKKYSYVLNEYVSDSNKPNYELYNTIPKPTVNAPSKIRIKDKFYDLIESEISSDINKTAFSTNIYGDDASEIIFTDSLETEGYLNNLGMPLNEIYLSIIKTNKGYKEWYGYGKTPNPSDEYIEYSHCFGKVTSGYDMCSEDDIENMSGKDTFNVKDFNVKYLHNIEIKNDDPFYPTMIEVWGDIIKEPMPKSINDNITKDSVFRNGLYGDVIEFSPSNFTETVISENNSRFNTAQRELVCNGDGKYPFMNIWHDEIETDDYDREVEVVNSKGSFFKTDNSQFKVVNETINGKEEYLFIGNIAPEGYYYKTNYRIVLNDLSSNTITAQSELINFANDKNFSFTEKISFNGVSFPHFQLKLTSPLNYNIFKGDMIAFYSKKNKDFIWGSVIESKGKLLTIMIDKKLAERIGITSETVDPKSEMRDIFLFYSKQAVPYYAKFILANGKFIWRDQLVLSETNVNSEIYNRPFSNGNIYIHENVNFFLKRQDPEGKNGLLVGKNTTKTNPMEKYTIPGYPKVDTSYAWRVVDFIINSCY